MHVIRDPLQNACFSRDLATTTGIASLHSQLPKIFPRIGIRQAARERQFYTIKQNWF